MSAFGGKADITATERNFNLRLPQQLRQLGDVHRNPPRLVFGEQSPGNVILIRRGVDWRRRDQVEGVLIVQVLAFALTAEVQREKLLRQIEESLAHSHELIARIEGIRRNRSAWLAQAAASASP